MKSSLILFAVLAVAVLAAPSSAAPQAGTPGAPAPAIKAGPGEIRLDIVIRDKKGRTVNDIRPDDLTVFDNGVKQAITSLRLVQGKDVLSDSGVATPLDALRQVRLITLVFETMADADLHSAARNAADPLVAPTIGSASSTKTSQTQGANSGAEADRRRTAQKGALELLKDAPPANVYYSVVALNTQLLVLQPFTQDTTALAKAVERATSGVGASALAPDSNRIKEELHRFVAEHPLSASGAVTPASIQTTLAQTMLDMTSSTTANAGGARLTIDALQSLSSGLSKMPGRKTVFYFTPGLYLPPQLDIAFTNLKGLSNRANVAIYSFDTRGPGQNEGAAQELNNAIAASGSSDIRAAMHASDAVESAGRANVQLPIRELAEDTGGFLVSDTNNLAGPLRRAVEEVNNYYELAYDPGITEYDGSFRKVRLQIGRKDAVAHARSGYLALAPGVVSSNLQSFELPLLKAITDGLASKDVEYRAAGVLLQPRVGGTDIQVFVELPLRTLSPKTDPAKNTQSVHFAMAALIKNPSGEVVQKLTRDRSLNATEDQLKAGNFTEKFSASLPAGKYSLETAVMDRESGKLGAQRSELIVAPKQGVAVSSITPVKLYNPGAKPEPGEPFQYQNGTISPMLLSTLTVSSPDATLPLFFTVYPDSSITTKPTMEIEFLQGGHSLGKLPLPLAEADSQGRIPTVFSVPAGKFPEGTFVIHAIAKQGNTTADTRTEITIKKS